MTLKFLAAAALVVAPVPAQDQLVFKDYPGVYKIDCDEGSGTGFRVGANHFLSVAHVTTLHNCSIDGHPIKVTEQNGELDFSQFDADVPGPALKVSCEGYHAGEWVWAVGHAKGLPFQTTLAAFTTYAKSADGKRVFVGEYAFIPGMSGGPVFNVRGEVIGTVNAYIPGTGISLSRDLRDTSLCR